MLCFHRAELLQDGARRPHPIPATVDLRTVRIEDLLATHNFISTASIVFRRDAIALPDWFRTIPFGDLTLCCLLSRKGGFHCIDAFMSVYRITGHGLFTKVSKLGQWLMFLRFYTGSSPHTSPPPNVPS
ncbi:MAG: hypothetical protein IPN85_12945 [Flavobacteriales bacterium]|nr:hypothetical protein [Flavobacteriales bacterium]